MYVSNQRYLQYAEMTVINNKNCSKFLDNIFPSTLCAGGENKPAPCYGDRGGPLVLNVYNVSVQIGIASSLHKNGCMEGGSYAAFVDVKSYIQWIKDKTGIEYFCYDLQ